MSIYLFTEKFTCIPEVIPSDEMCIKLGKQHTYDTSRKYRWNRPIYNFDLNKALGRGGINY
jgi:hypothetical protein